EDIDKYAKRFDDIVNRRLPVPPGLTVQKEYQRVKDEQNAQTIYKIQDLFVDDVLFEYCKHPNVLDYVEAFIGPNLMAIHNMLINKPSDSGSKLISEEMVPREWDYSVWNEAREWESRTATSGVRSRIDSRISKSMLKALYEVCSGVEGVIRESSQTLCAGSKSSRHPLHQDISYFPLRPMDGIVCAWTAMETVNRANGCLVCIPGTHKGAHLEHWYPEWDGGVNKGYYGVKDMPATGYERRVHLEMEAGDCIFFHPLLIHGSGTNRTQGFRKAISCDYASSDCQYIDVKGTLHEKMADEIMEHVNKSIIFNQEYGKQITNYSLLFKTRAQLVRGMRINV
ncbi:unnamed protein product, partial [Oppiella nova]